MSPHKEPTPPTASPASRPRPKNPEGRRAVGEVIRDFRKAHGWSQDRLAYEAGYDRAYIGQLERGQRWPTLEAIWYVLHALGVGWDEFGAAMQRHRALRGSPSPRTGA